MFNISGIMKMIFLTHIRITILVVVILAASCNLSKEYQRPELELPEQFQQLSFADTSSIADIEWKQFFTDTTLLNLIQTSLTYNQDLLIAVKRIDIAKQQVRQAKLLQLPELDLRVTGQYSRPSDNSLNGISIKNFLNSSYLENYQAAVGLSWEADIWGKIRAQKEITLAQFLQTTEAAKAVQTQLIASVAQGYYELLMLDKQEEISRKTLALNDTFVTATKLLKDAGIASMLAVQRAEAQKQSTELLIPQLQERIALQENALKVLTGQLPGKVQRHASISNIEIPDNPPAGLPVAMVSRRPDVRSSEIELQMATKRIGIAEANMYPALNITAGVGLESFKASNWFNIPGSLFGLAAGTIAQPLFKRRELKTRYETAKIEREQAVIEFRQSVLIATREVSDALVQTEKLKQQQEIATAQVATFNNAVTNAQLLFKSDMANYLEVITAQSSALLAELNLAAVQRNRLNAVVDLYRSLGGGWK